MSDPGRSPFVCTAERTPEAKALVYAEGAITYGELLLRVRRASANLMEAGLRPGAVVALRLEPGVDAITLIMACLELGVLAAPLNPKWPGPALGTRLDTVGPAVLITDDATAPEDVPVPVRRVSEIVRHGPNPDGTLARVRYAPERPALLVFTSGSTGPPKAALLSHGNVWHAAGLSNANIPLGPGKRWLLSLPLYHVSGLSILFRCFLAGASVVLPQREQPLQDAMAWYGVTHASLVAAQLRWLLFADSGAKALSRLDAVLLGGGPMPAALLESAHAGGVPIHVSYGLTEMASQVATTPPGAALALLQRGAPVLEEGTVRIGGGEAVELRGAARFGGYWNGAALEKPFDADGWFRTGDRGALDAEGVLTIHGRLDNMFISGGENIQPEEIELALVALPGVGQAAVVPVADETYGQRPFAFLLLEDATIELPGDFDRRLRAVLPSFMVPVGYASWPHDLAGPELKVNRPAFAERAAAILTKGERPAGEAAP